MNIFDDYFELQKKIHEYFGYVEDWKIIPLEDFRDVYWVLHEDHRGHGEIVYKRKDDGQFTNGYEEIDTEYYAAEIYTQRFLDKWVYRTEEHTMVAMNPGVDGNYYLGIFTNSLEQKDIYPFIEDDE